MKSTINSTSEKTDKPYPKLMKKVIGYPTIYLMKDKDRGTIIHHVDQSRIGEINSPILSVLIDWDGSVTLWA